MSKKKQLFVEILTNKDWEEHIKFRDGLVLAEVYSEVFGPSTAMQSRTKQYKVEQPEGDLLTLAVVSADGVELVKRFKNQSEPTFLFLVSGLLVNSYIGCNAPRLIRLLDEEFKRELNVRRGIGSRSILPLDKPSPAEVERKKRLDATAYAERRAEEERRAAALLEIRLRAYEQIAGALKATSVVLFLTPCVEANRPPEIARTLKEQWAQMGIEVVREVSNIITEEMANEIFFERKLPQHKLLVDVLQTGYSFAFMLKKVRPGEGEEDSGAQGDAPPEDIPEDTTGEDTYPIDLGLIERYVAETVYGFFPDEGGSEEEEEDEEENFITPEESSFGEEEGEEEDEEEETGQRTPQSFQLQPREMRPPADSPAAQLIRRLTEERVNLPGIYAPFTPFSKAAAVRVLFPLYTEQFYEVEELPPDPPPSVVVAFDAGKRQEVQEIAAQYPQDVLKMGLFNDRQEKLTDTVEEYDKLGRMGGKDTIVLQVAKKTSAPLLALAAATPLYISPFPNIAKDDDRVYFGEENIADPQRVETPPEPLEGPVLEPPADVLPKAGQLPVIQIEYEGGEEGEEGGPWGQQEAQVAVDVSPTIWEPPTAEPVTESPTEGLGDQPEEE